MGMKNEKFEKMRKTKNEKWKMKKVLKNLFAVSNARDQAIKFSGRLLAQYKKYNIKKEWKNEKITHE